MLTCQLLCRLLEGGTVRAVLNQLAQAGTLGFAVDEACTIIKGVIRGVSVMHETGKLCHLDIKSENAGFRRLGDANSVTILDYGLARGIGVWLSLAASSHCGLSLLLCCHSRQSPTTSLLVLLELLC